MADDRAHHSKTLAEVAATLLHARDLRLRTFPTEMFSEIAWDMLLTLYRDEAAQRSHSVTSLCSKIVGPPSIAQRWLDYLLGQSLVARTDHLFGSSVRLTELGRTSLEHYLEAVSKSD